MVRNLSHDIIIGLDFFIKYNVSLDFTLNELYLKSIDTKVKFSTHTKILNTELLKPTNLFPINALYIEPMSQQLIEVTHAWYDPFITSTRTGFVTNKDGWLPKDKVSVADGIVNIDSGKSIIALQNNSEDRVFLDKNSVVAQLWPAEITGKQAVQDKLIDVLHIPAQVSTKVETQEKNNTKG